MGRGEGREEVSDVNYPSQSFPAPENKCKCGHGEKREEGTTNPTAILSKRTCAKTLQTKTTITAKEDVKCSDRDALDKMLFLSAVRIMQTIILGAICSNTRTVVILELNPVKEYNHPKMKILSFSIHPHADGKSGEVAQSPKTFLKPHGKTAM